MTQTKSNWHTLSSTKSLSLLNTDEKGLSREEVKQRHQIYGSNQLKTTKKQSSALRFLLQFHNILIYILLASTLITILLKEWVDACVIITVVILNAVIGFIQEGKAEKALDAIRNMLSPKATVIRDGKRHTISAKSLVPGDIVLLSSGDKVPADLRLLHTKNLQIQEAILTGESNPIDKSTEPVDESKNHLGDRTSMAYSGTLVTYGRGTGVVVAIGKNTEIGRISSMIAKAPIFTTPLLKQIAVFGRWLTLAIVLMAVFTFFFGLFVWGNSLNEMFMVAVSLSVAAIPEGLPAIITITLAIGVTRMAKRNAIIRKLPAVEIMGVINTICTDKTGTITRNELAVQNVVTGKHTYSVTGSGYNPEGEFQLNKQTCLATEHPDLEAAIKAAILCNDAELTQTDDEWRLNGNPTDGALLALGLKAKLDLHFEKQARPATDIIPFESEHKFMASLHHDHEGKGYIYVKGAPERILEMCKLQNSNSHNVPLDMDYWEKQMETLASKGQRLIAIAYYPTDSKQQTLCFEDINNGLILLGLFGLIDPPREEAIAAVAQCKKAGIDIKMITGDHALTAKTIGESVGIDGGETLTGAQLDAMSDADLLNAAENVDIYARTTPEHKLRLVKALQKRGHVVAMTGDGVNDAPALRQANIGIAMGQKGTEATKEVAEMVLADDNFASIAHAVEEGRTVYDNLKKAILFTLPNDVGEAAILIMAIVLGKMMPISALQILWINTVTTVALALSLGFEPPETNVMQRSPRPASEPILSKFLLWRILFVSSLFIIFSFGLFLLEQAIGSNLATTRTVVVNMIVMLECVYLINCRKLYSTTWNKEGLFGSKLVLAVIALTIVLQMFFTYLPFMQHLFNTAAIGFKQWGIIIAFAIVIYLLIETEKVILKAIRSC
jgi:magnesium-transporting ATPase (P-type)